MVNGLCPNYLQSLVPPTIGNSSRYNLRNVYDIRTVRENSELYYKSFLPSVIRERNELLQSIRDSTTLSTFKYRLNSTSRESRPPSYYFEGSRLGHARLRTGRSSLNQHLVSKNIVNSPLCVCGSAENTSHYLLNCTIYAQIRQDCLIHSQPSVIVIPHCELCSTVILMPPWNKIKQLRYVSKNL